MATFAAVMTGKGTGAIATVQLVGNSAAKILQKIFKSTGDKPSAFKPGSISLGIIQNGSEVIDQVLIGCQNPKSFAINCHGNPLIVEMIMQLLQKNKVTLVTSEQLLCKILSDKKQLNTIEIESKLTQPKAKTLEGTKIVVNQADVQTGLNNTAREWLKKIDSISLDEITVETQEILQASAIAEKIIFGCKAIITGPPNTGKSTLLNCLAGRQKAIVTDIKGTTRDYVTTTCRIKNLSIEFVDTAGLDEKLLLTPKSNLEKISQQKSLQLLDEADLILLVLDNSLKENKLNKSLFERISDKRILTVLNKSDLPAEFEVAKLPQILSNTVLISAKFGTAIDELKQKITEILAVTEFDLTKPLCFTSRQKNLLEQLKNTKSKSKATSTITELLNGKLRV